MLRTEIHSRLKLQPEKQDVRSELMSEKKAAADLAPASPAEEEAGLRAELGRLAGALYDDFEMAAKPGTLKEKLQAYLRA